MSASSPLIYWIRTDFRLQDNAALKAAIETGRPIVPLYLHDRQPEGNWALGGAAKWWLHQALEDFLTRWKAKGGRLILRVTDDVLAELSQVIEETGAEAVYWNRRYEPAGRAVDERVKRELKAAELEVRSFQNELLVEPHTVSTGQGKPYKVYTPFWKAIKDRPLPAIETPALDKLRFPSEWPRSEAVEDCALLPELDWPEKLATEWQVGEDAAQQRLDRFLDGVVNGYNEARDIPSEEGTSRLSPYLRWGHIGPRQVAHRLHAEFDLRQAGPQVYMKELYWREFAYNVLYHFPETADDPLRPEFKKFPWQEDAKLLAAWQRGKTGYPIVDAGMRQLYQTGWMHNRVRMIVASLLVKHLLQPWQAGARWFWDTLVDADLASNSLGWQWSGGCGADAAPYFRIFNPITQGEKFDPEGDYVRQWVPELKKLSNKYIHQPWEAPSGTLQAAGIRLGEDYPKPIIDHKAGRARALAAFEALKNA
ncbi:MAG: deoxyribodipyrimidine photo-lyase [Puniceicoccaceae bacterium]|nr:MAG: deoxyribodipyrimidine photo-lyase [Puniceicoccaceae bacterium]